MKLFYILVIFFLYSCTTLKKQQFYSGLGGAFVGGTLGALIGKELSPNEGSDRLNQTIGIAIGSSLGALGGAGVGTFFWNDSPENKELNQMIIEDRKNLSSEILGPNGRVKMDLNLPTIAPEQTKIYRVEEGNIPEKYKNIVSKKGFIREYDYPQYTERLEDGREIIHEKHKAFEYVIEDINE